MIIDVYVQSQILEKKLLAFFKEAEIFDNIFFHRSVELMFKSMMDVRRNALVIFDTDLEVSIDYYHKLKENFSEINIISIGRQNSLERLILLHKIGFLAHIDFDFSVVDFIQALNKSHKGQRYLSASQSNDILNHILTTENFENKQLDIKHDFKNSNSNIIKVEKYLTDKEKPVAEFLLKGYSYKEISEFLGTTTYTVNQRVRSIYKKLEVRSRSELSYKYLV